MEEKDSHEILHEQLRAIKQSLRTVMNGPVSQSMRDKGLTYKVNFGVELPRLREMAAEMPHTYELAAALWKEDIRECRLLAGMLMPPSAFDEELADVWVEQMRFNEEAECTVMHLFVALPTASSIAFRWVAMETPMFRLCGWLLFSRLLMKGCAPSPRDAEEFLDQAQSELQRAELPTVRRAAHKALLRYGDIDEVAAQRVDEVLDACGL
jgi:hypothetical protein